MSRSRSPLDQRLSRRAALRAIAGGALVAGVAGCGDDGEEGERAATAVAGPPLAAATPTQEPIASPVPGYPDPQKWAGRTLTVASWGGAYQEAQTEAIFEPFALGTGAEVVAKRLDPGRLRQQVETAAVTWDVVDLPMEEVLPLSHGDYLTPIDYQRVDRTVLFEEICLQHGVGAAFFSTVLAYPANAPRIPEGWTDFWDVAGFGKGRALARSPIGTLEFALLADGVPMADLYPLDVPRAFAKLDEIRPHVVEWYQNNRQPVALVVNGDAALASAWNVRVAEADGQAPVGVQWQGGMMSAEAWVIPRGAENEDVAMDFVNFATRAVPTANFSRLVPFGPVNKDAFALLRPDRLALLPSAEPQRSVQFPQNWNYWADHREELTRTFEEWLLTDTDEGTATGSG